MSLRGALNGDPLCALPPRKQQLSDVLRASGVLEGTSPTTYTLAPPKNHLKTPTG